jgi:hypothetical protein
MMRVLIFSVTTVAVTGGVSTSVEGNFEHPPYGLVFSPTTIPASRFNSSGSSEITRFSASRECQWYYEDTLRNMEVLIADWMEREIFYGSVATMIRN